MNLSPKSYLSVIFWTIMVLSCNGGNKEVPKVTYQSLSDVPVTKWEQLSTKKIYFGHQSVGNNILDGIRDVMKENPQIKLNIVESKAFSDTNEGAFFHSGVGKNTDPISKIKEFESILTSDHGDRIDPAFLKLCYVDITAGANPAEIFKAYLEMIERIRTKNTNTKMIHFTVPLTVNQTGLKAWVKNLMGKPLYGVPENIKRYEYNQLLKSRFEQEGSLFDIAEIESTKMDGSRMTFMENEKEFYQLSPEYTNDGGHLNELGRKIAAQNLLLMLLNQSN